MNVLNVNVTGVFRMTRAALLEMLRSHRGSIVNISSIASLVGIPMLPAYAASKGALDALTRAIAIDYAKEWRARRRGARRGRLFRFDGAGVPAIGRSVLPINRWLTDGC